MKLANIRKSMQIRKPVVPTKKMFLSLSNIFGKMSLPQTVYFYLSNFLYKLTQPTVQITMITVWHVGPQILYMM